VKLIVGLGNPGPRYDGTRHNVGFAVVDELGQRWSMRLTAEKFHAWFDQGEFDGHRVALMKPSTYMNRSGQAVVAAGRFYKLELPDLLVIVDDMALPLGRLRMRASGSSGGHNGLQDILDRVGSDAWARLRLGIGPSVGDPAVFVTTRFAGDEENEVHSMVRRAADAVEVWVRHGCEKAMTTYNAEPSE